jgi:hypothetical protein
MMKKNLNFKYIFLIGIMLVANVKPSVTHNDGSNSKLEVVPSSNVLKPVRARRQTQTGWVSKMLGSVLTFFSNPASAGVGMATGVVDSALNLANTIHNWNDAQNMLDKIEEVRETLKNGFSNLDDAVNDLGNLLGNRLQIIANVMEKNSRVTSGAIDTLARDHLLGKWEDNHRETITDMMYYTEWALHQFSTSKLNNLNEFDHAENSAFVDHFNKQKKISDSQGKRPLVIRVQDLAGAMRQNNYKLRYEYFTQMRIHVTLFLMTELLIKDAHTVHNSDVILKLLNDLRAKSLCLGAFKQDEKWYESAGVNPCSVECVNADNSYYGIQSKTNSGRECLKWNHPEILIIRKNIEKYVFYARSRA